MTTEWTARRSVRGDKILCGRTDGHSWLCDGLIAYVMHNTIREWIQLLDGDVEVAPGIYGPSGRARQRMATGQAVRARARADFVAVPLSLPQLVVEPPFRKKCPMCRTMAVVPTGLTRPIDVL